MDTMTSVLSTAYQLDPDRDGPVRNVLFRTVPMAFKVWAHGVDLRQATKFQPEGTTLTQTITLSIGGRTDEGCYYCSKYHKAVNCGACGRKTV